MNIIPQISIKYPENSYGGECGDWAHKIVEFPSVGNTYYSKKKTVQLYGVLAANVIEYRVGDVLICSDGTWMGLGAGHVCVVANLDSQWLYLAESNYKSKYRVSYGRKIARNDKRIYGLLRGKFLIDLKLPETITLQCSILMQYVKPWDSSIFLKLNERIGQMSDGKIRLDIFPVYTYNSLKNWWYETSPLNGVEYTYVASAYVEENVAPLGFANENGRPQIILWSINKAQWQGTVVSPNQQFAEYGWTYYGWNPIISTITCDEGDKSFRYDLDEAFIDYATHEITHGLSHWGRIDNQDNTDAYYWQGDRSKAFTEFDYTHLAVNLLP